MVTTRNLPTDGSVSAHQTGFRFFVGGGGGGPPIALGDPDLDLRNLCLCGKPHRYFAVLCLGQNGPNPRMGSLDLLLPLCLLGEF